jgi:hypothetical protein
MTAIATTKTAIAATVAAAADVALTSELNSANVDVAVTLGLRWAERKLKVDLHSPSDRALMYNSARRQPMRFDTFGHTHSCPGHINVGVARYWGRNEIEITVSSTNSTIVDGNVIWHVASLKMPLRKVRTVEQAAALVEKLLVAAASPAGRKALGA